MATRKGYDPEMMKAEKERIAYEAKQAIEIINLATNTIPKAVLDGSLQTAIEFKRTAKKALDLASRFSPGAVEANKKIIQAAAQMRTYL